jgi:hypothetical protein
MRKTRTVGGGALLLDQPVHDVAAGCTVSLYAALVPPAEATRSEQTDAAIVTIRTTVRRFIRILA